MKFNSIVKSVSDSIILACVDDYVGLWEVCWTLRQIRKQAQSGEIKDLTIEVIRNLLSKELIQAGNFKDGEWEFYNLSNNEVIALIKQEWNALNREPSIGDIIWFTATEKGKEIIKNNQS